MSASDREAKDAARAAARARSAQRPDPHPLGPHRRRAPDRARLERTATRSVTGCSPQTAQRLLCPVVSEPTPRARRDKPIQTGTFDDPVQETPAAHDRIVGIDPTDTAATGSAHKTPSGGPDTAKNPTARRRPHGTAQHKTTTPPGQRRPIERTNPPPSNFGQPRHNTDPHPHHQLAQLALAIALLICIKLTNRRNRWPPPIRQRS